MTRSPSWAADYAEGEAEKALDRERALNCAIEAHNPCARPTPRYEAGPLPPSSPQFSTRTAYLHYEMLRARGKYNPTIVFPLASPSACAKPCCGALRRNFHRKFS